MRSEKILLLAILAHSSPMKRIGAFANPNSVNDIRGVREVDRAAADVNSKATFMFSGPSQAIDATSSSIARNEKNALSKRKIVRQMTTMETNSMSEDNKEATLVREQAIDFVGSSNDISGGTTVKTEVLLVGTDSTFSKMRNKVFANLSYKYNLIWSPGSVRKFMMASIALFAIRQFVLSQLEENNLVIDWNKMYHIMPRPVVVTNKLGINIILPLLASACCMIQLTINLLAGGCFGFNTVLGSSRPFFLSLLFFLTFITRSSVATKTHFVRWAVALMPEAIHLWNNFEKFKPVASQIASFVTGGHITAFTKNKNDFVPIYRVGVKLSVPTMGCVACINKIDLAVRKAIPRNRLLQTWSQLKDTSGGDVFVEFQCTSKDEIDGIVSLLIESIDQAGFGKDAEVDSVRLQRNEHNNNG